MFTFVDTARAIQGYTFIAAGECLRKQTRQLRKRGRQPRKVCMLCLDMNTRAWSLKLAGTCTLRVTRLKRGLQKETNNGQFGIRINRTPSCVQKRAARQACFLMRHEADTSSVA